MTKGELTEILRAHAEWRADNSKGKRADLGGANLHGADLHGANLSGADLSGADLHGAYLHGANLRGADLSGAYLYGANLDGANLSGADLSGADLRFAYLGYANLSGANLSGADLSGADLDGANHVVALGQPNGWWAFAYLWEGEIWVRVGCRTKSLAEGRTYWAHKKDRREVLAALDYAEIVAKLRGWEILP